jgi:hypothetical protein
MRHEVHDEEIQVPAFVSFVFLRAMPPLLYPRVPGALRVKFFRARTFETSQALATRYSGATAQDSHLFPLSSADCTRGTLPILHATAYSGI